MRKDGIVLNIGDDVDVNADSSTHPCENGHVILGEFRDGSICACGEYEIEIKWKARA